MKSHVVLIHGLWMTPLSWEQWADRLRDRGYTVHTPSWPRMDHSIDELRADPGIVGGLGVREITDHHQRFIESLDESPVIIGHSVGGLVTQLLLDRGTGTAGVAVHPGQTKRVYGLPPKQLRAAWPALGNPFNLNKGIPLTAKQFHWGFANALTDTDALKAWETFHVPAPARPLFQAGLGELHPASGHEGRLPQAEPRASAVPIRRTGSHRARHQSSRRTPTATKPGSSNSRTIQTAPTSPSENPAGKTSSITRSTG